MLHRILCFISAFAVAAGVIVPAPTRAARVTDVADAADIIKLGAFERADPFDAYFTSDIEMVFANGKLTREPIDRPGLTAINCSATTPRDCHAVDELRWSRETYRTNLRLEIGLFHDVSLVAGWHYVMADELRFRYAAGVDATNSTVDPQGTADLNGDGTADGRDTLFPHNFASKHVGSGSMDLGLRFAPLSDERDDSKPAWVLFFNWAAPWTSETFKPELGASLDDPGSVGDGMHRLTFGTSLSKRLGNFGLIGIDRNVARRGYLDPYMLFSYTLPLPSRGGKGRAVKANREAQDNPFGHTQSSEFHLEAGFEVVPYEDLRQNRKIAVDLGIQATMVGEGRNYTVLTDPLGELTFVEPYVNVTGVFGLYLQVADYLRVEASFRVGYDTEHFITNEDVGIDNDGDNQVLTGTDDELNPYFCGGDRTDSLVDVCDTTGQTSVDQIGFRFKDEEHTTLSGYMGLVFTF
jgi:hypothetical protein